MLLSFVNLLQPLSAVFAKFHNFRIYRLFTKSYFVIRVLARKFNKDNIYERCTVPTTQMYYVFRLHSFTALYHIVLTSLDLALTWPIFYLILHSSKNCVCFALSSLVSELSAIWKNVILQNGLYHKNLLRNQKRSTKVESLIDDINELSIPIPLFPRSTTYRFNLFESSPYLAD